MNITERPIPQRVNSVIRSSNSIPTDDASIDTLVLTKHAKVRMKQRSIKSHWVNLVLEYGKEAYQKGKRSTSFSLDKLGVQKLKKAYGKFEDLNKLRQVYVVVSDDGAVVTCAYR
jgi:hypothetical protein